MLYAIPLAAGLLVPTPPVQVAITQPGALLPSAVQFNRAAAINDLIFPSEASLPT